MSKFQFSLVIGGSLKDEATLDALFEAGCDDATLGQVDGVGYADFIREASSFAEAVRAAIEQVESVPGLRVVRVEPDDLVARLRIRAIRPRETGKEPGLNEREHRTTIRQRRRACTGAIAATLPSPAALP